MNKSEHTSTINSNLIALSVKRNTEGNVVAEFSLPEIAEFVRNDPPATLWVSQDGIETPISTGLIREFLADELHITG